MPSNYTMEIGTSLNVCKILICLYLVYFPQSSNHIGQIKMKKGSWNWKNVTKWMENDMFKILMFKDLGVIERCGHLFTQMPKTWE
jgi:hypothetical protein